MQDRHHISGIREPLPHGETLRWEGRPDARLLARHVLRIRAVAIYFVALLLWAVVASGPEGSLLARVAWILILAGMVLAITRAWAFWIARTTAYSITDGRLVIVKGVVLPSVVNLPLRRIRNVTFHRRADGSGGIALELVEGGRIGYTFLWPHARPWKFARPEPMLRCLTDVDAPAEVLREVWSGWLAEHAPEPQHGPTEYRLLDDDDTPVLSNTKSGMSPHPSGGAA